MNQTKQIFLLTLIVVLPSFLKQINKTYLLLDFFIASQSHDCCNGVKTFVFQTQAFVKVS